MTIVVIGSLRVNLYSNRCYSKGLFIASPIHILYILYEKQVQVQTIFGSYSKILYTSSWHNGICKQWRGSLIRVYTARYSTNKFETNA